MLTLLALCLPLAVPHGGAPYRGPEDIAPQAPAITLPPCAAGDHLTPHVQPAPEFALPAIPAWADAAWRGPELWNQWAEALASPDQPASRVTLAMVARSQGRYEDMWDHIGELPARWAQPLVTALMQPVVRAGEPILLAPPLPPTPRHDRASGTLPPKRIITVTGLSLPGPGAPTLVDMVVEDTAEGVEVALTWKAGPPLEVLVEPPVPPDRSTRTLYFDWEKIDIAPRHPVLVAPRPEQNEQSWVLWARTRPLWIAVPRLTPGQGLTNLPPIQIATVSGDPELERLKGFAAFLDAALGIESEVLVDPGPFPDPRTHPDMGRTPLRMDFAPSEERTPKWITIAAAIEANALIESSQRELGSR